MKRGLPGQVWIPIVRAAAGAPAEFWHLLVAKFGASTRVAQRCLFALLTPIQKHRKLPRRRASEEASRRLQDGDCTLVFHSRALSCSQFREPAQGIRHKLSEELDPWLPLPPTANRSPGLLQAAHEIILSAALADQSRARASHPQTCNVTAWRFAHGLWWRRRYSLTLVSVSGQQRSRATILASCSAAFFPGQHVDNACSPSLVGPSASPTDAWPSPTSPAVPKTAGC